MKKPPYWNHNIAYYRWIKRKTKNCHSILDVGCGDGSLVSYLDDGDKHLVGIDSDDRCIQMAKSDKNDNTQFFCSDFITYTPEEPYDAVIFVASIHHMDAEKAIQRAKAMLRCGGVLLIVGLAKPSSPMDFLIEGLRVLPSAIVSRIKRIAPCEKHQVPIFYGYGYMKDIRRLAKETLPCAKIRPALHYRYLLQWRSL